MLSKSEMEDKLSALAKHENGALAEELLRVWVVFSLEERLPLYFFHPDLLVNLEPSRKDLLTDLSILKSYENVNAAAIALSDCRIIVIQSCEEGKVIRLSDDTSKEDRKLIKQRFFPTDGSDGSSDDLLLQVAKFAATISPQLGLADILHYHFEALHPHMFRFANILLKRYYESNCNPSLKAYIRSADVCLFMLPLSNSDVFNGIASIYLRTLCYHPSFCDYATLRQMTIKLIEEEIGADALKTEHKLRLSFQIHQAQSPQEIQEIFRKIKSAGHQMKHFEGYTSEYFDMIAHFGSDQTRPAKSCLERLHRGFDNGTFCPVDLPESWRKYLKASALFGISAATMDPSLQPLLKPFVAALEETRNTAGGIFPHLDKVQVFREMQTSLLNAASQNRDMESIQKLLRGIAPKYTVAAGPCDSWCAANFSSWFASVESEDVVLSMAHDAISQAKSFYGPCSLNYIATILLWLEISAINYCGCGFVFRPVPVAPRQEEQGKELLNAIRAAYFPEEDLYLGHLYCYTQLVSCQKSEDMENAYIELLQRGAQIPDHQLEFHFLCAVNQAIFYELFVLGDVNSKLGETVGKLLSTERNPDDKSASWNLILGKISVYQNILMQRSDQTRQVLQTVTPQISLEGVANVVDILIAASAFTEVAQTLVDLKQHILEAEKLFHAVCGLVVDALTKIPVPRFIGDRLLSSFIWSASAISKMGKKESNRRAMKWVQRCAAAIQNRDDREIAADFVNALSVVAPQLSNFQDANDYQEDDDERGAGQSLDDVEFEDIDDNDQADSDQLLASKKGKKCKREKTKNKNKSKRGEDSSSSSALSSTATLALVTAGATLVGLAVAFVALRFLNKGGGKSEK